MLLARIGLYRHTFQMLESNISVLMQKRRAKRSRMNENDRVVDQVKEHGGFQAAGFLEQQSIGDAQQTDGQPRQRAVIDGEKRSAADHRAPTTPFAIQGPEQQP